MTTQTIHIIQPHNGAEIIDNTMFANRRMFQMEKFERRWKLEAKTKRKTSVLQRIRKRIINR